jgi:phosphatidylserine/phosphatidylglycerophosphate/cardiolipin synthase-like enzyme
MRPHRIAGMLVGVVLLGAVFGCSGTKPAAPATTPPVAVSTYTLITEPDTGYQPVYDFIAGAKTSIDMTMYNLSDTTATAGLVAAAKRGVNVRVLFDSNTNGGGNNGMNQAAAKALKSGGVDVAWSWPGVLWHQKSIVRDGSAVAIMNCNLYSPDYPVLRDFIVITDNPPTVQGVQATFEADFNNTSVAPTTGVVPVGSELLWSPGAQAGLVDLIGSARPGTTLYNETEQLNDPAIEQALIAAAKKGVIVNVTMTNSPYWASAFKTLKAGGVHVSLYASGAPLYIQAKAISVNNDTVYIGSTNETTSSISADRNVGIITKNPTVVSGVTSTLASDFAAAKPY